MKKKLAYISPENFYDVDFGILHKLNSEYDLYWIVIFRDQRNIIKPNLEADEVMIYAKNNGIKCNIKQRKGRIRNLRNIFFDISILKSIKKFKPDIIYIESFVDLYFSLISALILPKNKTIIGIHDVIPHVKDLHILKKISNNIQIFGFKKFHLFSKTQQTVFQKAYPKKQTFLAQLTLKSIDGFDMSKNKMQKDNQQTIFLFFGFIRYNKGLDYLIQAVESLIEKGTKNFKLIIQGKCDNWNYFQQYIKHPEFFEVNKNFISNNEIPDLFCSCHFLILPYRDVTQSGPLFFAFNYNLPIIASDLKGFQEYIENEKTGLLFKSESVDNLAEILLKAIEMNNETYQGIKHYQNTYKELNMSSDSVIKGYIQMFEQIS